MNTLEEFDPKLKEASTQLADLVGNTTQVKTINELLEKTDAHWESSLEKLTIVVESIQRPEEHLLMRVNRFLRLFGFLRALIPEKL